MDGQGDISACLSIYLYLSFLYIFIKKDKLLQIQQLLRNYLHPSPRIIHTMSSECTDSKLFLHHERAKINKLDTAVYNGGSIW